VKTDVPSESAGAVSVVHAPFAGGAFILDPPHSANEVFTPEKLPADAHLMARSIEEFVRANLPAFNEKLKAQDSAAMPELLRSAGELGLLGTAIPEQFGGLNLPKSQIALLTEKTGINPAFAISCGVHCGVAMLPILYFGTESQRERWLPKLATGEILGAFALSEAETGSDALSARTRATLSDDGSVYVLNGAKMWVTNGAFANLFVLFARADGGKFTAFLVERSFEGITVGREEHKLGLKGSSTARIVLDNVRVPVANVLGEVGKGHYPALYALNLGRFSIAATALGMCKESLRLAAKYANSREQFGKPISSFGLIRQKLAAMAIRTLVLESMLNRTAGDLDGRFGSISPGSKNAQEEYRRSSEEYAIECAILKFMSTETLGFVVDEALQIHGGYGYSEEFPAAQAYRDARVFRIFEGTNEVNRLTVIDQILKRDKEGRIPLTSTIDRLFDRTGHHHVPIYAEMKELYRSVVGTPHSDMAVQELQDRVRYIRLTAIGAFAIAQHRNSSDISDLMQDQEIIGTLAEMFGEVYAMDSLYHRCRQVDDKRLGMIGAARAYGYDAGMRCWSHLQTALAYRWHGDNLHNHVRIWREVFEAPILDVIPLQRKVADLVIDKESYPW
jgi:alkylation response protein AidB-like acyl-CoA dehydrogenase